MRLDKYERKNNKSEDKYIKKKKVKTNSFIWRCLNKDACILIPTVRNK
jgi:hypothetical protein